MRFKSKLASSLIVTLTLSGCSSIQTSSEAYKEIEIKATHSRPSGSNIYADLVKNKEGWRFEKINKYQGHVQLPSMHTDLYPQYEQKLCMRPLLGIFGGCKEVFPNELEEFSSESISSGFTAMSIFIYPIFIFSGLSIFTENSFDWDEYADAVTEAKEADKYDDRFNDIYNDYIDLDNEISASSSLALTSSDTPDLIDRTNAIENKISGEIRDKAMSQVPLKVIDNSGLADLDKIKSGIKEYLNGSASLTATRPVYDAPSLIDFISSKELKEKLLPAHNLDNLKLNIEAVKLELADILKKNQEIAAENNNIISKTNDKNLVQYNRYKSQISDENSFFSVIDAGVDNLLLGFTYDLSLPVKTKFSKGKLDKSAVIELTIKNKNGRYMLPSSYVNKGRDIEVILEGKSLSITNLTGKYITLDAVSLYHDQNVLTKGGSAFQNYIELAPGSITTLSLNEFDLSGLKTSYQGLTKEKAKKTEVQFGFAVKYRITDENTPKTLYEKKSYNLYKLL